MDFQLGTMKKKLYVVNVLVTLTDLKCRLFVVSGKCSFFKTRPQSNVGPASLYGIVSSGQYRGQQIAGRPGEPSTTNTLA